MKKCNARGSAARDPHGIKQITVGPPHGIKQITMFIRENVECLDSSFTTTTTIKARHGETGKHRDHNIILISIDGEFCSGRLLSLLLESISKEGFCLAGPLAYCQCQSRRGLTARVNLQGGILFRQSDGEFCSGRLLSLLLESISKEGFCLAGPLAYCQCQILSLLQESISKEGFCLGRSTSLLPVSILFTDLCKRCSQRRRLQRIPYQDGKGHDGFWAQYEGRLRPERLFDLGCYDRIFTGEYSNILVRLRFNFKDSALKSER
ncbi:hypothetical protein J6590_068938 [Homalodisca vitripennis]|nr:hypothetical protein J6590_068938 [Homalodisca vitripennis]